MTLIDSNFISVQNHSGVMLFIKCFW